MRRLTLLGCFRLSPRVRQGYHQRSALQVNEDSSTPDLQRGNLPSMAVHVCLIKEAEDRVMAIDPQVQALLDEQAATGAPPLSQMTVEAARAASQTVEAGGPPEPLASVDTHTVPGSHGDIPVRIYRPSGPDPLPVLVYCHGGGFVLGHLDTYDPWCRHLANLVPCIVVAVDYHLAPEFPFPAAVDDALAATEWAATQATTFGGDPARIAVGGDSAGGNLAAVVSQVLRGRSAPMYQVLLCPATDHYDAGTSSYQEYAVGCGMTRDDVVWLFNHYLPPTVERDDARAYPLRARDVAGVAPALVVTAECDVLRDEGEEYAARLQSASVPSTLRRYDGMIHNFQFSYDTLDGARRAVDDIVAALQTAFHGAAPSA